MVIEFQGKRYSVVGQTDTHYICTETWQEDSGESFLVSKDNSKVIT